MPQHEGRRTTLFQRLTRTTRLVSQALYPLSHLPSSYHRIKLLLGFECLQNSVCREKGEGALLSHTRRATIKLITTGTTMCWDDSDKMTVG